MAQPVIQHSFHAGEWAPALNARVDLQKYHAGAALLRNFFVDYRGGASSCPGTRYILQAFKSATGVRLIPFAASFTVNYVLEFGDSYIRFYNNGAPVLETGIAITGATKANPCVVTVANTYAIGDWVYIAGVVGMTQLNGNYYSISARSASTITLADLNSVAINSTGFSTWTSGGTTSRVYTLLSPYAAGDLSPSAGNPGLKFAQNVNTLVICHPSYVPYVLTIVSATNWTLIPITFGATISAPTGLTISTSSAGTLNLSYLVTANDANGQESAPSAISSITVNVTGNQTVTFGWASRAGAVSYNVYRTTGNYLGVPPAGSAFGFVAFTTGVSFQDAFSVGVVQLGADFTTTPPIIENPFQGAGVQSATITVAGTYTTVPGVTIAAAPSGGITASANAVLGAVSATVSGTSGTPFSVGQVVTVAQNQPNVPQALTFKVSAIDGSNHCTAVTVLNAASISSGATPANPIVFTSAEPGSALVALNVTWGVVYISIVSPGAGYTSVPAITFSAGAAAATAVLATGSAGNPSVPAYFQQRLVLAGPPKAVQTFYMSQPGSYYNYNISDPIQANDAITGSIVSSQLNTIKSMITMPPGLMVLADRGAWLVNGGASQTPITPIDANAQSQAYVGSSDLPPIVVNYDVVYVQAKGSYVRDLTFNFYTQIYTGTDISVLSSHLFYGFQLVEWAFAEEPFKIIWAVRNDGTLLSLTFLKEQEVVGWAHRDTNGLFKSICAVVEAVTLSNGNVMNVDATYVAVQRTINGNTVQYIERMAERIFPAGATDAWCVDAGIQYRGAPATTFSGAQHLAGATVTGVADGVVITPFVMPVSGTFTLASASVVTVGLAYTPQLQTLQLDLGEPTVQGKRKKITGVTVRCQETLGLSIGKTFTSLVPMKDLVVGNVGSATNSVVADLVTGDARTIIDPSWDVPGQYAIQQSSPLPASILGVIPEITIGDTPK